MERVIFLLGDILDVTHQRKLVSQRKKHCCVRSSLYQITVNLEVMTRSCVIWPEWFLKGFLPSCQHVKVCGDFTCKNS